MRNRLSIILLSCCLVLLASCQPEPAYRTKNVTLDMKLKRVSSGFIQAEFIPSKKAYFYVATEPVREGFEPMARQQQFMTLALDYAYKEYINWRFGHLYEGEEHIAEFSSHCLQYGELDKYFTDLKPDTDYWVYGFIVDPETNKPCSDLVLETVHTAPSTTVKTVFEYRINDVWDYVYPMDEKGDLCFYIPWVGETIDSVELRKLGVKAPGHHFISRMQKLQEEGTANIFYGMYAHKNDGVGDGTSSTRFEDNHTYYTAIASFDGPLVLEGEYRNYSIYKFTWHPGMQKKFLKDEDTLGAW